MMNKFPHHLPKIPLYFKINARQTLFIVRSVLYVCWFAVYIRRFIYKFLNVCPFDYTAVAVSGKVGP